MEGYKVLIIEDDVFLSDLYKSELEALNLQVDQAQDGAEGLAKAAEAKPDLILLDIVLPNLSGLEVLQKIKDSNELEETPVLLITNVRDHKTIDKCLEMGAKGYFLKATTTPSVVAQEIKNILTAQLPATS